MTETAISKAIREVTTGARRDLADAGCPGLRLRLTPGGAAAWVLACRDRHGRMRRFPLGGYPAMGISDARSKARELHTRVRQEGADPIADRRRERVIGAAAKVGEGTLSALLSLYERQRGAELKRWAEAKRSVEVVFKSLLGRPLVALKSQDFQMLADGYSAKHAAGAAVRYVRPVLKWGTTRGYIGSEVAALHLPVPVKRRRRILTREEIAAVLPVLRTSGRPHSAAMRFMLLTLTRRQETALARWRDVNMEARSWTIPERTSQSSCRSPSAPCSTGRGCCRGRCGNRSMPSVSTLLSPTCRTSPRQHRAIPTTRVAGAWEGPMGGVCWIHS